MSLLFKLLVKFLLKPVGSFRGEKGDCLSPGDASKTVCPSILSVLSDDYSSPLTRDDVSTGNDKLTVLGNNR